MSKQIAIKFEQTKDLTETPAKSHLKPLLGVHIQCNCPRCKQGVEPTGNEKRLLYNTLYVKAKDWGRVKLKWGTSYRDICLLALYKLSQTFNQKHYQWVITDRIGHLLVKSDNTTDAEFKEIFNNE